MNNFTCEKCGQKFKMEHHLKQHLARKRPCIIVAAEKNPLRCIHCNRIYSTMSNLLKHSRKCKMKNGGVDALPENIRLEEKLRIMEEERKRKSRSCT